MVISNEDKTYRLERKIRSQILSEAINVELDLLIKLREHFSKRKHNLYWYLFEVRNFKFDKKIKLFEKISRIKKWENREEIMKSLKNIKDLRNVVAHWEKDFYRSNSKKVVLVNPSLFGIKKTNRNKKDKECIINEKVINSFNGDVELFHRNVCHTLEVDLENPFHLNKS